MARFVTIIVVALLAGYLARPVAAGVGADPFSGAVQVAHFSFENQEDLDFDGQPDDWTRRRGDAFPTYIDSRIDRQLGYHGTQSLCFDANGGSVATYSPPIPIGPQHSYVFRGYLRTQMLEHNAAMISISLLNHKRERVQRLVSQPVTGTHSDWIEVSITQITPQLDVRFIVVGCHLVKSDKADVYGRAWFDSLWIGSLPQLKLSSSFAAHFKNRHEPIQIEMSASGLNPDSSYRLLLEMVDRDGKIVERDSRVLQLPQSATERLLNDNEPESTSPRQVVWELPPQDYGFFRIVSRLERDGQVLLEKETTFTVIDGNEAGGGGEFGWSVGSSSVIIGVSEIALIAGQAGISWLKYPVWDAAHAADVDKSNETSRLFEELERSNVTPVGILGSVPGDHEAQFGKDWSGVSELFSLPPSFWSSQIRPVVARYSSNVRHWQLGSDDDRSFAGLNHLQESVGTVKRELDQIGRNTNVIIPWDWNHEVPSRDELPQTFVSIDTPTMVTREQLQKNLIATPEKSAPRWVLIRPLEGSQHTLEERGTDLVLRMVAAKIGRADGIFAADVFGSEGGLLNSDGSPTQLFLPWRSAALALRGMLHLGSINMPSGSQNQVFANVDEAVIVVWNEEPTTERMYLGEDVEATDIWGRRRRLNTERTTGRQIVDVGPIPLILRRCNPAVARWRLAVQFEGGRLRSEYGGQAEAILGKNAFSQGINGTVKLNLPKDWEAEPSQWELVIGNGEDFRLPMFLTLPPRASLGVKELSIDFEIAADRPYRFRVYRPYQVGIGDIVIQLIDRPLPDGRLEIEQIITNKTEPPEILNLSCSLFVVGHKRQKKTVTKLGLGEDHKFYYIPDAAALQGQEIWLRAEQVDGRRVLNYRWIIGSAEQSKTERTE